ncbi:hypothetical protein DPMN_193615 [Dreissena polymorpha]|uniref:Uncharacterized protein n=1 Tax=Dreissena polymorpha TaxID=45954 RepID=A0A9D4B572_DREPO|nr:hypothetical protein DPMN_193615 [Dreissena polymorpha]
MTNCNKSVTEGRKEGRKVGRKERRKEGRKDKLAAICSPKISRVNNAQEQKFHFQ